MSIQVVHFGPFNGGVRYDVPPELCPYDALSEMQNAVIGNAGECKRRLGYEAYISAAYSASACQLLGKQRFSSSSDKVFAIFGAAFVEDIAGTWTDRTGSVVLTANEDNLFSSTNANGTLYFVSSADGLFKWTASATNITTADVDSRFTKAMIVVFWDDRLWYAKTSDNENYVWYSDKLNPETVGATSFLKTDDVITAMAPLGLMMTVHTKDAIWGAIPTGSAAAPLAWQHRADIGSQAWKATKVDPLGNMYLVRSDGIYVWSGSGAATKISGALEGSRYWDQINGDNIAYADAVVFPANNWVMFLLPYGATQDDNNHIMIWDYGRQRWMGPYTNFTRNYAAYFDSLPHFGDYAGRVYKHESSNADNGSNIAWVARTSGLPPQGITPLHRWLFARHEFDRQNTDATIAIAQYAEDIASNVSTFEAADDSDALVTEFIIGTSAIAGASGTIKVDSELWGWSCGTELRMTNTGANPITYRRTEAMYELIEEFPTGKPVTGVFA